MPPHRRARKAFRQLAGEDDQPRAPADDYGIVDYLGSGRSFYERGTWSHEGGGRQSQRRWHSSQHDDRSYEDRQEY